MNTKSVKIFMLIASILTIAFAFQNCGNINLNNSQSLAVSCPSYNISTPIDLSGVEVNGKITSYVVEKNNATSLFSQSERIFDWHLNGTFVSRGSTVEFPSSQFPQCDSFQLKAVLPDEPNCSIELKKSFPGADFTNCAPIVTTPAPAPVPVPAPTPSPGPAPTPISVTGTGAAGRQCHAISTSGPINQTTSFYEYPAETEPSVPAACAAYAAHFDSRYSAQYGVTPTLTRDVFWNALSNDFEGSTRCEYYRVEGLRPYHFFAIRVTIPNDPLFKGGSAHDMGDMRGISSPYFFVAPQSTLVTLSECPGDFGVQTTNGKRKPNYQNNNFPRGACGKDAVDFNGVYFTTDVNADENSNCIVERGKTYYWNVIHGKATNPYLTKCAVEPDGEVPISFTEGGTKSLKACAGNLTFGITEY